MPSTTSPVAIAIDRLQALIDAVPMAFPPIESGDGELGIDEQADVLAWLLDDTTNVAAFVVVVARFIDQSRLLLHQIGPELPGEFYGVLVASMRDGLDQREGV